MRGNTILKRFAFILALATLVQGCWGAAIAGATVAGVIIYEGRSPKTLKKDNDITYIAQQKLIADKALIKQSRMTVASYDGILLLAGQTPTPELRERAGTIVSTTPGVKRVYNEITIGGPISPLTQSSDAWITTKLKGQLLANKALNAAQIKVVTENGTIFLLGNVTKGQANIAAQQARKLSGVQKVVKIFEYTE